MCWLESRRSLCSYLQPVCKSFGELQDSNRRPADYEAVDQWWPAIEPASASPIFSVARLIGSSARWAYRCVVVILLCPSSRPPILRFCPPFTPKLAKVWRRSCIRTSGISASRRIRSPNRLKGAPPVRGRLVARDHEDLARGPLEPFHCSGCCCAGPRPRADPGSGKAGRAGSTDRAAPRAVAAPTLVLNDLSAGEMEARRRALRGLQGPRDRGSRRAIQ